MKTTMTTGKGFSLSRMIGTKVFLNDKKIGKLADLIIYETEKVPEVSHFVVARPFGYPTLYIPSERVENIEKKEILISIDALENYEKEPKGTNIFLRNHILDKKVLDLDDNEVEVVYDVKLILRNNRLYASDVDISKYALLKRLGLKKLAKFIYNMANKIDKETISWTYIQHLPEHISSFKGDVKLKVLKEKLSEIHPVDLADILEELDPEQRVALFSELETEHASDTLEEIEPPVQRVLISSITKERAAELIDEMTPAQAADILAVLPNPDADNILKLLDEENAHKIQYLLDKHDENISNFATSEFIKLPQIAIVGDVLDNFRTIAKDKDEVMYIYIIDMQDKLLGVIDLKELLQANPEDKLEDVMITHVISLSQESTLSEAAKLFARYSFRSIPITDDNEIILGVIPYRDVMNLKHRFI